MGEITKESLREEAATKLAAKGRGFYGHKGVPGQRGGSAPRGGGGAGLLGPAKNTYDRILNQAKSKGSYTVSEAVMTGSKREGLLDALKSTPGVEVERVMGSTGWVYKTTSTGEKQLAPTKAKAPTKTVAATKVPALSQNGGKDLTAKVKEQMATAGMPRTSTLGGGENTGLTKNIGSTGFSVRDTGKGLSFNVVVGGKKAGVRYRKHTETDSEGDEVTLHTPTNQASLHPKIQKVFQGMGFKVNEVRSSGYQQMWDDDVEYTVDTDYGSVR